MLLAKRSKALRSLMSSPLKVPLNWSKLSNLNKTLRNLSKIQNQAPLPSLNNPKSRQNHCRGQASTASPTTLFPATNLSLRNPTHPNCLCSKCTVGAICQETILIAWPGSQSTSRLSRSSTINQTKEFLGSFRAHRKHLWFVRS